MYICTSDQEVDDIVKKEVVHGKKNSNKNTWQYTL